MHACSYCMSVAQQVAADHTFLMWHKSWCFTLWQTVMHSFCISQQLSNRWEKRYILLLSRQKALMCAASTKSLQDASVVKVTEFPHSLGTHAFHVQPSCKSGMLITFHASSICACVPMRRSAKTRDLAIKLIFFFTHERNLKLRTAVQTWHFKLSHVPINLRLRAWIISLFHFFGKPLVCIL